jgi:putative ABC transport system ATP-binding protein
LLSLLAGLANPDEGQIIYDGKDIAGIDKYDYRANTVGVIFQSYNLLAGYTAAENVLLSMKTAKSIHADGATQSSKKAQAIELLARVGISETLAKRRVLKLSGGEQQRVAIARAISYDPKVVLADEPTGNLDAETADAIMDILVSLAKKENRCIIIVTHDERVAKMADKVYRLGNEKESGQKEKGINR